MFSRKPRRYSPEDREQIIKAAFETVDRLKKDEQDYAAQRVERRRGRLEGEADDEIIRRPVDDSGLVYKQSAVQRQATPHATAGDDWNAWLAAALSVERKALLTIIAEHYFEHLQDIRDALAAQLRASREMSDELAKLRERQAAMTKELKAIIPAKGEVIDMPNPLTARTVN